MAYYRTPSGSEVDFIWTRGSNSLGIEVKASERWRPEHGRALAELHRARVVRACFGLYLGEHALRDVPITVRPLHEFLCELAAGRVLRPARRS